MVTEASFALTGDETYIRVTCQDGRGLHADSNAYELNGKEPVLRGMICVYCKRYEAMTENNDEL